MPESLPNRWATTRNRLLLTLAAIAGYVDAISYLGLDNVFTANMTGNTVLLGIAVAQLDGAAASRSTIALVGFLAGAVAGARIGKPAKPDEPWPQSVTHALGLEGLVLIAFTAAWLIPATDTTAALITLSAIAMGIQSAAIRHMHISGVATTYITGTLTNLVARFAERAQAGNADGAEKEVDEHDGKDEDQADGLGASPSAAETGHRWLLAAVWIVYITGATVAAVLLELHEGVALSLPPAMIVTVVIIAAVSF